MNNDRLRAALKNVHRKLAQEEWFFGFLGRHNPDGSYTFQVRGRANFVYVTLRLSSGAQTVTPARNDGGVPFSANLPVRMRVENGLYIIDSVAKRDDLATVDPSPGSGVPIHEHDNRYYRKNEHIATSTGAPDAGKPAKTAANGKFDPSLIDLSSVDIGAVIDAAPEQTTPEAANRFPLTDTGVLKWISWTNILAALGALFEAIGAVATHAALTTTHGVTGNIVGTGGAQTLTSKTLTAPVIADYSNAGHDHGDADDGGQLGTGALVDDAVTYAKMQNIATDSLIGRDTASSGDPENITLNATLSMTGAGALQRAALTGDVTAPAGSNATTIANDAVTFAKMQNVATDSVLGRATAGTGDIELITLTAFARTLIDDVAASNARTTLGLGTIATEAETNYLLAAGTRALTGEWDIGEDMAIRAERFEARDVEGLRIEDDGGNDAIFIADGGLVAVGHANAPLKKLHVGVGAGSAILVQGGTTVGETAEILFKMSATDFTSGFIKGAMYFVRSASNARGDIIFALNNVADSSNVSTANAVMALLAGGQAFFGGLTSGGANVLGVKAGTSTNDAAVGGVLFVSTATVNSPATVTGDLGSYTVPANTLAVNGQSVWFEASGTLANGASIAEVSVWLAGSELFRSAPILTAAADSFWSVRGRIIRTGATTIKAYAVFMISDAEPTTPATKYTVATVTLSSSNILKMVAHTDGTAADIVMETFVVGFSDSNT